MADYTSVVQKFIVDLSKEATLFATAVGIDAPRQAADSRARMHESLDAMLDKVADTLKTELGDK